MGVIAECKRDSAPAVAGEKQCRYCKAAYYGTCPAYAEFAAKTAAIAKRLDVLPKLSDLPDDFLCELAGKFKVVAKFADRVRGNQGAVRGKRSMRKLRSEDNFRRQGNPRYQRGV